MQVRYQDSYLCKLFNTKKLLHSYVRSIAKAVVKCGKLGDVINCSGGHVFIKCSSDEDTHTYIRELDRTFIVEYLVSNTISHGVSLRCDTITLPIMIMKVVEVGPLHRYDSVVFDVIIVDNNDEITETTYRVCF